MIPDHCFEISTARSLAHLALSLVLTAIPVALAVAFLPLTWAWAPAWVLYALVTGTAAIGLWVLAHECGHGAFSRNRVLQDTVGFVLHTAMVVPYFSWQRSHAVHHAKTNHLTQGETHVPRPRPAPGTATKPGLRDRFGRGPHAVVDMIVGVVEAALPSFLSGKPEAATPVLRKALAQAQARWLQSTSTQ